MAAWKPRSVKSRCRGASAITIWMVEQLGLATTAGPAGRVSPLISGTTKGTAGSMRQAEELSTTRAPASTKRGAHSLLTAAPR